MTTPNPVPEPPVPNAPIARRFQGKVVAAGKGHIAAQILVRAREAGVPVHQDPQLARALSDLALGQEIPEQMWTAVAQVLGWAYGLSEKRPTPNR